jgi:hypothetical protein
LINCIDQKNAILITLYINARSAMTNIQVSDEELQLYFNYLMKNNGVLNVKEFSELTEDQTHQYSAEELALEVV